MPTPIFTVTGTPNSINYISVNYEDLDVGTLLGTVTILGLTNCDETNIPANVSVAFNIPSTGDYIIEYESGGIDVRQIDNFDRWRLNMTATNMFVGPGLAGYGWVEPRLQAATLAELQAAGLSSANRRTLVKNVTAGQYKFWIKDDHCGDNSNDAVTYKIYKVTGATIQLMVDSGSGWQTQATFNVTEPTGITAPAALTLGGNSCIGVYVDKATQGRIKLTAATAPTQAPTPVKMGTFTICGLAHCTSDPGTTPPGNAVPFMFPHAGTYYVEYMNGAIDVKTTPPEPTWRTDITVGNVFQNGAGWDYLEPRVIGDTQSGTIASAMSSNRRKYAYNVVAGQYYFWALDINCPDNSSDCITYDVYYMQP